MAQTARAERFPLSVPLRFRKNATSHWLEGRTMNLSRTDILFKADEALPADSLLEIRRQKAHVLQIRIFCRIPDSFCVPGHGTSGQYPAVLVVHCAQ